MKLCSIVMPVSSESVSFSYVLLLVFLLNLASVGCSPVVVPDNVAVSVSSPRAPSPGPPVLLMCSISGSLQAENPNIAGCRESSDPGEHARLVSASGVPLSDGSILTVDHAAMAIFGRPYIVDGMEYWSEQSYSIFNDGATSRQYTVVTNYGKTEDGLLRFSVPEVNLFPRYFEFDLHNSPRMTNEEFDEKYPVGTPVTISGYVTFPINDEYSSQRVIISMPRKDELFALQRITTEIAPGDWFDWTPNRNRDFLYFLVPGGVDLGGMSGGPITATGDDGVERLIGVLFFGMRVPLHLFGKNRFLGLYFYPWRNVSTPQVMVGFKWPYDSAVVTNPQQQNTDETDDSM